MLECYRRFVPVKTSSDKKTLSKKTVSVKPQQNRGMLVGYAHVSTQDQNLELQTEALQKAGCKKIFEDRMSGSRAERPSLTQAREGLRAEDTLIVWKLDRLGRSDKHIANLVREVYQEGIQFKSLTDFINPAQPPVATSSTLWPVCRDGKATDRRTHSRGLESHANWAARLVVNGK